MTLGQPIEEEAREHKPVVDSVGVISEIISNISDQRNAIRELLSNAAAKKVGARHVGIRVYESDRGLSFTVEDNGCGMDYTNDPMNPGRLDKFLNIAQGKQAGYTSDEFGAKGLGAILLYNCRRIDALVRLLPARLKSLATQLNFHSLIHPSYLKNTEKTQIMCMVLHKISSMVKFSYRLLPI